MRRHTLTTSPPAARRLGPTIGVALGTIAIALAAAPTANAATIASEGGVLVVRATPGEKNILSITEAPDIAAGIYIDDSPGLTADPGLCEPAGFGEMACKPQPGGVRVEAGDGDDRVNIGSDLRDSQAVTILGGPGNDDLRGDYKAERGDHLDGGDGNDWLVGGPGADTLIGGAGDDKLEGQAGNDELRAGDGNDRLSADGYRDQFTDVIDGGAGYDDIDGEWMVESGKFQPPINVSMDGVANDGRPGENDNVTGIEKTYHNAPITLVGGDAAETFTVFNTTAGSTTMIGNGGDDSLNGFSHDDTIDGGAGDDRLQGGFGDDTLTGGPGRDLINADRTGAACNFIQCDLPFGNDLVNARDGEVDSIECGIGQDTAIVDTIDVVSGCETVQAAAAGGGTAPGGSKPGGSKPGGSKPGGAVAGSLAATARPAKLRAALARGFLVEVSVPGAGAVTITASRAGKVVARGSARVPAGAARTTVRVRITKAGRSALRRAASARLTLSVTFRPPTGTAVTTTAVARLSR